MDNDAKVRVGRFIGHFSRNGVVSEADGKAFVYFITDGEFVKIGKSNNHPKIRLKGLQTGNARTLTLLFAIPVMDSECANNLECAFHKAYEDFRVSGEWFNILPLVSPDSMRDDFGVQYVIIDAQESQTRNEEVSETSEDTSSETQKTEFLRIREVAKRTGLPECFLRRLVKQHKCPGFYSGNRFYVAYPNVLEVLDEK